MQEGFQERVDGILLGFEFTLVQSAWPTCLDDVNERSNSLISRYGERNFSDNVVLGL